MLSWVASRGGNPYPPSTAWIGGHAMNSLRDKQGRTASPYPSNQSGKRYCPDCKDFLPFTEFYKDSRTSDGLTRKCRTHHAQGSYKARKKNPQHATRDSRYEYNRGRLLAKYGLTAESFDQLLATQGGICPICQTSDPKGKGWVIDHDHSCCSTKTRKTCGKCVRGILCSNCNTALGKFQDDPEILQRAISYL